MFLYGQCFCGRVSAIWNIMLLGFVYRTVCDDDNANKALMTIVRLIVRVGIIIWTAILLFSK